MKQKPTGRPSSSEQTIRDIKRKTRKQYKCRGEDSYCAGLYADLLAGEDGA